MSGYILGVDADVDLNEIWEYIATDSIDAADGWIRKLSMLSKRWGEPLEWATHAGTSPAIRFCSGLLVRT
jgi:plasmid stabilization system protein ParE